MDKDAPRYEWSHALTGTNEQRLAALDQLIPAPTTHRIGSGLHDEPARQRLSYELGRRSVVEDLQAHHAAPPPDHVL